MNELSMQDRVTSHQVGLRNAASAAAASVIVQAAVLTAFEIVLIPAIASEWYGNAARFLAGDQPIAFWILP